MRLADYLDLLAWSQTDLARNAGISVSTVHRVLKEETISRKNAQAICSALSKALKRTIVPSEVSELHIRDLTRPRRTKRTLGDLFRKS